MKIIFQFEKRLGAKVLFYPVNDHAKALIKLMKRKALVPGDGQKVKDFCSRIGVEAEIDVLPPKPDDSNL